jgi:IS30 family transposase
MPIGYHHLIRDQRSQIYALKSNGLMQQQIAAHLKVHPSTFSRELKRSAGARGYRFQQADGFATERRSVASSHAKCMTPNVIKLIEIKIREKWSPEQISGRLKLELGISVSHETIYQHIWQDKKNGGDLYTHLRHSGKKYNKRSSGKSGRGCIPNRVDIKERPKIVEEKKRLGDWEGDTIIGAQHKGALLTIVDRKSKFTLIEKLDRKTADEVVMATEESFARIPDAIVHTITYDNGKEFSDHEKISNLLDAKCYFATPYHSWERGLNEHTNGLIRQYLPKDTDLSTVPKSKVKFIEDALNDRPRKVLNFMTPKEVRNRHRKPLPMFYASG